jgi:hypothetical protein
MKAPITYLGMIISTMGTTAFLFDKGMPSVAYTCMIAGACALLAFQGKTEFHRPYWAHGIETPQPTTGHILAVTIITEAACLAIAIAGGSIAGIIGRIIGLCIQAAAVGKLSRDFTGGTVEEQLYQSLQDKALDKRRRRTP